MLELLAGFPENVIAIEAVGEVEAGDYREVLVPATEAALEANDKIRLLYVLGERFEGVSAGAAWEDLKLGLEHLRGWETMAVVTDVEWIGHALRAVGWMIPAKLRVFPTSERAAAEAWVLASVPSFHTNQDEYSSAHRNVYHDHAECSYAQAIKPEHRLEGTDGRPRCAQCERLAQRHPG
jgi:hypothetical protein